MNEEELRNLHKIIDRWVPGSRDAHGEWLRVQIIEFINQILSRREGK